MTSTINQAAVVSQPRLVPESPAYAVPAAPIHGKPDAAKGPIASGGQQQSAVDAYYVQRLQCAIEHCLCHYLDREQTVDILAARGWHPGVTNVVWWQLATENPKFFEHYRQQLADMTKRGEAVADSVWAAPQPVNDDDGDSSDSESCSDAGSVCRVAPAQFA